MTELTVKTSSREYPVFVSDSLSSLGKALGVMKGEKVAIVTDENVSALYPLVEGFFGEKSVYKFVIEAGENSKSPENFIKIQNFLAENGFTRSDSVVAFGGGVVGDLAAFCASTYMRGITLVAIPTTILSAVDSSVGGKTAINLDRGKNLCGSFYQPSAVYICTEFFKTLPEREIACGLGEVIKYAFLSDTVTIEDVKGETSVNLIEKCLKIKADIVGRDENERGDRKLLNLGHTVGHAIERLSGFGISHGECVVKGLFAILNISKRYFGLSDNAYERALEVISCRGHDLDIGFSAEEIYGQILSDKKSDGSGVDLVLICEDLSAKIVRVSYIELKELLKWI